MFRTSFAIAMCVASINAAATPCDAYTAADGSSWNLTGLKGAANYSQKVGNGVYDFNFCEKTADGWYGNYVEAAANYKMQVANLDVTPGSITALRDEDGLTTGVSFVNSSGNVYKKAADNGGVAINYSQKTEVTCDKSVDTPKVDSITNIKGVYTVYMTHKSGCPTTRVDPKIPSGWKRENCRTVTLAEDAAKGKLDLCYYYQTGGTEEAPVDEFHGDLTFSSGTAGNWEPNVQMGFCMIGTMLNVKGDKQVDWQDCYVVTKTVEDTTDWITLDPKKRTGFSVADREVEDPKYANTKWTIAQIIDTQLFDKAKKADTLDPSMATKADNPAYNFQNTESKNDMNCAADAKNAGKFTCTKLNAHFFRNWQSEEPKQDLVWAADTAANTKVQIYGFVTGNSATTYTTDNAVNKLYTDNNAVINIKPAAGKAAYLDWKAKPYTCPDGNERAKDAESCVNTKKCKDNEKDDYEWVAATADCPKDTTEANKITCIQEGFTDQVIYGSVQADCPTGYTLKVVEKPKKKDGATAVVAGFAAVAATAALAF